MLTPGTERNVVLVGIGRGADVRRARLQGLRRAVPDLGARRLPGRARAGDAFLSAGPKAAAFAVFLRIFMTAFEPIGEPLGAAGLDLGAAYDDHRQLRRAARRPTSSACWPTAPSRTPATCWWRSRRTSEIGTAAAMFYLAAYAFMNIGAFAVVTHFSRQGREAIVNIEDLAGLGRKQPVTAGAASPSSCSR